MKVAWKIFALSAAYVGIPPLAYLLRFKVVAPMYLFAGDAFYYLDIARHSSGGGHGFSFDGEHATNGFHPLWEYLLLALSRLHLVDYTRSNAALVPVFILNLVLLTLGSAIFCVVASRFARTPLLALLAVGPGLLWLVAAPINPTYLSTWTFLNGMESAAALLCFACALFLIRDRVLAASQVTLVSLCLGLGVLARLDDIFIALPILAFLMWQSGPMRRWKEYSACLPLAILLLAYLCYNRYSVGVFLPISGATKAGFALGANLKWTARLFLPVVTGDGPTALMARKTAYFGYAELGGRLMQMLLPPVICAAELWRVMRKRNDGTQTNVLHACAFGVVLKSLYNFTFVKAWAQGPWYYAVSAAVANLVLVLWLDRFVDVFRRRLCLHSARRALLVSHSMFVLAAFNVFISHRNVEGPLNEVMLLANSQPLSQKLGSLGATRILEFDDGFTSYVANVPSAAGLGLALDAEGAKAVRSGNFLDVVYRRGYRIAVANGAYADQIDDAINAAQAGAHPSIAELHKSELDRYEFRSLGNDGSGDLLRYYRLVPKAGDGHEESLP